MDREKQIVKWCLKVYRTSKLESARYTITGKKMNMYGRPVQKTKRKTDTSEKKTGEGGLYGAGCGRFT